MSQPFFLFAVSDKLSLFLEPDIFCNHFSVLNHFKTLLTCHSDKGEHYVNVLYGIFWERVVALQDNNNDTFNTVHHFAYLTHYARPHLNAHIKGHYVHLCAHRGMNHKGVAFLTSLDATLSIKCIECVHFCKKFC